MEGWFSTISAFEKIFWYFVIPFTVIFIIQTVITFTGIGGDVDLDDGMLDGIDASLPIFTLRNFIIFFTVFGWTGIASINAGFSKLATIIVSVLLGMIVMFIVSSIFIFMSKLAESGNLDLEAAVNCVGEVYLTIPEKRTGVGKVQMQFQGGVREIDAVTDGETIQTGDKIRVIKVIQNQMVLVEKIR
ncbi:hypothetical protein [Caldisalinibacter kiritimatiensis]|uniref:NfeD-like C-terminal domain-containing protein n=1 Tax=Caldisalinibacter kiritimatiensis TaxID=1304284 RepID=R1CHU7_9FIRM|nr:hypothetical protein [Caldisalinibacter kiritimatiensis]EOD01860.1 hypothetical protein L21TH_0046 [Caldisalinibacter kiritimatiensis]